jgi:hypothetical protein
MISLLSLSFASALAAQPGDPVELGLGLHVTAGGLERLGVALGEVLPRSLSIDEFGGEFDCGDNPFGGASEPLDFMINDTVLAIEVSRSELVPRAGGLDASFELQITIPSGSMRVQGYCLLGTINQTCDLDLAPPEAMTLYLNLPIELALGPDGTIAAEVGAIEAGLSSLPNPIRGCAFRDLLDAFGGVFGDTAQPDAGLAPILEPLIVPALTDLGPTIETALADALTFLPLETSLDLLGAPLDVELYASDVLVDPSGVFIGLGATFYAPWDPSCASVGEDGDGEPIAPGGVSLVAGAWPGVGETPWGVGAAPYDVGVLLNADLVDMALYTVWQSGVLCLDVGELSPVALGTSLLGGLYGDGFSALFPEDQDAQLLLSAGAPPTSTFAVQPAIGLNLAGLRIDTYSRLVERECRIVSTDVQADVSLDAALTDGALSFDLVIDPAGWQFTEVDHELVPEGYAAGLADGLPGLISSFLPEGLLPTVPLPAFRGIGVGDLFVEPSPDGQWQGIFLVLDVDAVEPIELEGCSGGCDGGGFDLDLESALGCDDAAGCEGCGADGGCEGGCEGGGCTTPGRGGGRLVLILATFGLALRRRRADR